MEDLLPDSVAGLPLHPLVVHAVVVLVPLVALGFLLATVVPRWRAVVAPLVAVLATVALALVPVATASGRNLEASLGAGGEVADAISLHESYGALVLYAVIPLWLASVALAVLARRERKGAVLVVTLVVGVLAAVGSLGLAVATGHSGARAVWNPTAEWPSFVPTP